MDCKPVIENKEVLKPVSNTTPKTKVTTNKKEVVGKKETVKPTAPKPVTTVPKKILPKPTQKQNTVKTKPAVINSIDKKTNAVKLQNINSKHKPKYISELKPTGVTQSLFNVKDIRNGIIRTKNNRYLMILEIFPINFNQKSETEKLNILNNFKSLFIECPTLGHFKSIVESTDTEAFVNHILEVCPSTMDKHKVKIRDELIKNIGDISISNTVNYRYYYIFPYEGDDNGNRSMKFEDIYRTMMIQKYTIKDVLEAKGNLVAEPENPDLFTANAIYKILNKRTCLSESTLSRIIRVNYDYMKYADALGVEFKEGDIDVRDYFAPKGIVIHNKDMILADGLYYTYMAIKSNGYPESLPPDWMNFIRTDSKMDVDFFYKKLPHKSTLELLERKSVWSHVSLKQATTQKSKDKHLEKFNDSSYIIRKMKGKEKDNLFDCMTIVTLYDTDPNNLMVRRDTLKKEYSINGIKVETSHNDVEEYYYITQPFCEFEDSGIFKRCKRNFLTSTLKTNYMYTTFTLSDPTGLPLGNNLENSTLFSPNFFNTGMFINGNFVLTGSPGSGKSYFEMAFGRRCYINDTRVYYILPTKGYEYQDHIDYLHGTYARLTPGSKDCLNIMELYPEMLIKSTFVRGNEKVEKSILTKKITFLCTWFKLLTVQANDNDYRLSSKNMQRLNALLVRMYNDFGFTKDNNSIYTDATKTKKRTMPTISAWQQYLEQDEILNGFADILNPFTRGTFKNFDGQTNIDLSKEVIAFDIEFEEVGEEMQPAITYMAFDCSQNLVKSDEDHFGIILLDEGWQMLIDEAVAKQVESCARLIRGYGGAIGFATQSISEFQRNQYGSVILAMMKTKIILGTEETDLDVLGTVFKLSENDKNSIQRFKQGQGMFIVNDIKIRFKLCTSKMEEYLYTTDLNKKKELKRMMEEKKVNDIIKKK